MRLLKLIFGLFILSTLTSCSAEKLIQRAYKKDPSLLQQDTVFIPEVRIDTFYTYDTIEIKNDLDSILDSLDLPDSCKQDEIIKVITKYITNDVISDTLSYVEYIETDSVSLNLKLKIWQEDGKIRFLANVLDSKVLTPASVTIEKDKSLFNKKEEISMLIIFALTIFVSFLLIKR